MALLPTTITASAQTTPDVSVVPDPSLVHSSLSKITVQYLDARYGIAPQVDVSGITLTRKGSTEMLFALPEPAVDYAKLNLEFAYKGDTEAATVTTEGIYTLHIPAGAVTTYDTGTPLGELNIDFTVGADATTEMSRYVLTPEPGQVEEITTIEIAFPDSKGLDWFHNDLFGSGNFSAITLTLKSDPAVKYTAKKKKFDNNYTVTLCFVDADGQEAAITTTGTYVLDIPADMFMKDFSTVKNDHITAEYTIGAAVPAEFTGMISSPADGANVGRFDDLTLIFPNMPEGLDYPVNDIGRATVATPGGETFHGFNARVGSAEGGTYNKLIVAFAPEGAATVDAAKTFTEAGTYTVNIPAGTLKAYGKEAVNPDISLSFTVDPMLDFSYTISPAADIYHQAFGDIRVACGASLSAIALNPDCTRHATISLGDVSYDLTATSLTETTVTLSVGADAVATPGDWTVKIPAMFFTGTNLNGVTISNTAEITTTFMIREPQRFDYTIDPANGATIEFFKNLTVGFTGSDLKETRISPEAGEPTIKGTDGVTHYLSGRISGHFVIFTAETGTDLRNGTYSVMIPAGYISTVDRNNLTDAVGEITLTFTVEKKTVEDYTDGILFLNEGWFGVDTGSLNFLANDGSWTYDVFARNNPTRRLGVTSQYGQCFGNNIYVVSKQPEGEAEADGGVFTVIDGATMKFVAQIHQLPDDQSKPRAFCAWDSHKGYLSTKDRIYVIDLDRMEATSVVPGTDIYTSFDSNGEMLRYGNHVFAIRQAMGVDAIDPATDNVTKIPAELASAFAVTPDGSLYVATRNESNEFVKISPDDLTITETFDIEGNRVKIADTWSTWRKAPLAASTLSNAVYYVTQKAADESEAGARTVARYDFDTKEFDETFITLPGVADGEKADWILYGEGVSVDPATGYILLTAVEAGNGAHYSKNRVFVADPATGDILPGRTHVLDDAYWFPAMALYPDFEAPVIITESLSLPAGAGTFTLDLAAATTLAVGNRHLINYSATSSDESLCTVSATDVPGVFDINVTTGDAHYSIELSADYQGKTATALLTPFSAIGTIGAAMIEPGTDVYNMQGICVRRNIRGAAELRSLPAGIYIVGGRKVIVD